MSDKLQRSIYYYELLAKKHTTSALAPHQAQVYEELAALMRECSPDDSLEDVQARMKERGYWEKPAQALYLDKMLVRERAAQEFGAPLAGVAAIYRKQYDRVVGDYQAAFVTGWEQEVSRELNRVVGIVAALHEMFALHLQLRGMSPADPEYSKNVRKLRDEAQKIAAAGSDFATATADPYFRAHSALNDEHHAETVREIQALLAADPDLTPAEQELRSRAQAALDAVKSKTDELKRIGADFQSRCGRAVYIAVAPADVPGEYAREEIYSGPA